MSTCSSSNTLTVTPSAGLVINAPAFFQNPDFMLWLNNANRKFTWHKHGPASEWSDVVVLVDPSLNGEGSDEDMPEAIWKQILDLCRERFAPGSDAHIMVRLTNV